LARQPIDAFRAPGQKTTGAPVPPRARTDVLQELLSMLGVVPPKVMGSFRGRPPVVDLRRMAELERFERDAQGKAPSTLSAGALERGRNAARIVSQQLRDEEWHRTLSVLPAGSVLHGPASHFDDLQPRTPSHIELAVAPSRLDTVDDVAAALSAMAKRDGKTHAQAVNGALVVVGPGTAVATALRAWEDSRRGTPEQRRVNDAHDKYAGEIERRVQAGIDRTTDKRHAQMVQQLQALPPGTPIYSRNPWSLDAHKGIAVVEGPRVEQLEDAVKWVAAQVEKTGRPAAFHFNNVILWAEPKDGRGAALEDKMNQQFDRWA
jgi:hypothetical protein